MKFLLIAALLLAGCGPIYSTDYQLVPPKSNEGRMCANNCLMSQQNCQLSCDNTNLQCEQAERYRAENEFLKYQRDRLAAGKEVKRSESSFYSSYRCNTDDCKANCENTMRLCHTNCGGQVVPHTYCSAFCK